MTHALDELYFTWLYRQVGSVNLKNPARTYWKLTKQLFSKEFVWFVPNDDNRISDGLELRREFLMDEDVGEVDPNWEDLPCSMFELLIGISRRLSFEADGEPREWFWHMIDNLGLMGFNDKNPYFEDEVDSVLDAVIMRTYSPSGKGGLFPLKHPDRDQRDVEIAYQLNAYLMERD